MLQLHKLLVPLWALLLGFPGSEKAKNLVEGVKQPPIKNKIEVRWEKSVVDDLLTNYSTNYRPVTSNDEPVKIMFDIQLRKVVKLEIKDQVLTVNVFLTLEWFDPQLRWDPAMFNGTKSVNIEPELIWTPDIVLYNTAEDEAKAHTDLYKTRVHIASGGMVRWLSAVKLRSTCSVSILWFPFDDQECRLTFGSWSYGKSKLLLKFKAEPTGKDDVKKDRFSVDSGEWIFNTLTTANTDQKYACCDEKFSQIELTFSLSRRPGYYLLYLILPCVSLSALFLIAFYIPHLSGERVGFGVTMLLNMSVYLLVISDRLPEKSDTSPLIGILYVMYFYIMSSGLVASAVTNHLAYKTTEPPEWLQSRFLGPRTKENSVKPDMSSFEQDIISMESLPGKEDEVKVRRRYSKMRPPSAKSGVSDMSLDDIKEMNSRKWLTIAGRLDRVLLVLFAILLILVPLVTVLGFYISSKVK